MKNLKILFLLALRTFSTSQLYADITMTWDSSCNECNQVEIWNPPGGYAYPQIQNGKHVVIFPSYVKEGKSVLPMVKPSPPCHKKNCPPSPPPKCFGHWQPAKDGGTLSCWSKPGLHKEVGKLHSR